MDLDEIISIEEAAALCGLTVRRVNQIIADGYLVRVRAGRVRLGDVAKGYGRSLKASETGGVAGVKEELLVEQTRKLRRENDVAEGQLVDMSLVLDLAQTWVGVTVSEIGNLPARLSRIPAEQQRIEGQCRLACDRIRGAVEKGIVELLPDDEADGADEDADDVDAEDVSAEVEA